MESYVHPSLVNSILGRRVDLEMIKSPKLRSSDDLEQLRRWLPDPYDEARYGNAKVLLGQKGPAPDKVCLVGNIDLHHTLTRGIEEETREEVKDKVLRVGKDGGYIIASSNGLVAYCRPENVLAMNETILEYGYYAPH